MEKVFKNFEKTTTTSHPHMRECMHFGLRQQSGVGEATGVRISYFNVFQYIPVSSKVMHIRLCALIGFCEFVAFIFFLVFSWSCLWNVLPKCQNGVFFSIEMREGCLNKRILCYKRCIKTFMSFSDNMSLRRSSFYKAWVRSPSLNWVRCIMRCATERKSINYSGK